MVTATILEDVKIIRQPLGASWKLDQEAKLLRWIDQFKAFVENGHRSARWLMFIAGSYLEAAQHCKSKKRRGNYYLFAHRYFEEVIAREPETRQE